LYFKKLLNWKNKHFNIENPQGLLKEKMVQIPWIVIAIATLLVLLGIVLMVVVVKSKEKRPTDYYSFYIIGLVWTVIGIPQIFTSESTFFFVMGLVFMALGLSHKGEWKKNSELNKKFYKKHKWIWGFIVVGIALVVIATFVAFAIRGF